MIAGSLGALWTTRSREFLWGTSPMQLKARSRKILAHKHSTVLLSCIKHATIHDSLCRQMWFQSFNSWCDPSVHTAWSFNMCLAPVIPKLPLVILMSNDYYPHFEDRERCISSSPTSFCSFCTEYSCLNIHEKLEHMNCYNSIPLRHPYNDMINLNWGLSASLLDVAVNELWDWYPTIQLRCYMKILGLDDGALRLPFAGVPGALLPRRRL